MGLAHDVSADGSVVVGMTNGRAFVWDENAGKQYLHNLLEDDFGLDLTGWILESAYGVSGDGTTIVGSGINPQGDKEGWIVVIPEPGTLSLLALGGVALLRRRRV